MKTSSFAFVQQKKCCAKSLHLHRMYKALERLESDAFHPYLITHKLIGILEGSLACCAGYDLRIVFSFVKH